MNIYKDALERWGKVSQIRQAQEEVAELFVALNHYRRGRGNEDEVLEEIAGVEILLNQLKLFFSRERYEHWWQCEIDKLGGLLYEKGANVDYPPANVAGVWDDDGKQSASDNPDRQSHNGCACQCGHSGRGESCGGAGCACAHK